MILCNRNADMQEGRIAVLGSELKVINPTKQGYVTNSSVSLFCLPFCQ